MYLAFDLLVDAFRCFERNNFKFHELLFFLKILLRSNFNGVWAQIILKRNILVWKSKFIFCCFMFCFLFLKHTRIYTQESLSSSFSSINGTFQWKIAHSRHGRRNLSPRGKRPIINDLTSQWISSQWLAS